MFDWFSIDFCVVASTYLKPICFQKVYWPQSETCLESFFFFNIFFLKIVFICFFNKYVQKSKYEKTKSILYIYKKKPSLPLTDWKDWYLESKMSF